VSGRSVARRGATSGDRPGAQRILSLTFDDGPDPRRTPRVLEQLERCNVSATFFMVGEQVLWHPATARAVLTAGHGVELHCHRHIRHTDLSEAEIRLDAEAGIAALRGIGARPRLWRVPWGTQTEATERVAARLGLGLVRWSIDTHDWRGDSAAAMLDAARVELAGGGSVLMHDGLGPGARRSGCANTAALVPMLVEAARGLRLETGTLTASAQLAENPPAVLA
jgi:peptidoglycan-N-acetylglucosamine deacetylase